MKVLLIRFSSIGEIVLTTPVVRCLKKQLPNVEIHYLMKPEYHPVLAHNPYIDQLHLLQADWDKMIDELKTEKFDYIIDLQHDFSSLKIKKALKVPAYTVNKLNIEKFIYTRFKINVMPDLHLVDRYMRTVAPLGVYNDGAGLDYFIAREEEVTLNDIPASHQAGYIALVIGAAYPTNKLPVQQLQELCAKINHPIILIGRKEERGEATEISNVDPIKIYNACGKFSLNESADLIRKSKLVVTHHTDFMHIAVALKKPVAVIWGSTDSSLGEGPYYGEHFLSLQPRLPYENIQVHHLWCRPCTETGRQKCPQGHFKCMKKMDTDTIAQQIQKRLFR